MSEKMDNKGVTSSSDSLSKDVLLTLFLDHLRNEHDFGEKDVRKKLETLQRGIPISIFCSGLSVLESVVKYLRENEQYTITDMGALLKRSHSSLSLTYSRASKKKQSHFVVKEDTLSIPKSIFSSRIMSAFEAAVMYLNENQCLSITEVADILGKNYQTIWTVLKRARRKGGMP